MGDHFTSMSAFDVVSVPEKTFTIFRPYEKKLTAMGITDYTVFIRADPTTNKKYVRWIVDSYVNGGFTNLDSVNEALLNYEYLVQAKKLKSSTTQWENEMVIDNFCGLIGCTKKGFEKPGLESVLAKYILDLEARIEKDQKQDAIYSQRKVVYSGKEIAIIQPLTKGAACYYGQGTRWCTAATGVDEQGNPKNLFDHYKENLYVVIPKKPGYVGEKYQIHMDTRSIMDERDEKISAQDLIDNFPELTTTFLNEELQKSVQYEKISLAVEHKEEVDWDEVKKLSYRDKFKLAENAINNQNFENLLDK